MASEVRLASGTAHESFDRLISEAVRLGDDKT